MRTSTVNQPSILYKSSINPPPSSFSGRKDMALMDSDISLEGSNVEVIQLDGSSVPSSHASASADPLAMPPTGPQRTPVLRRRGYTIKCTSCARSKKRKYKVYDIINFSYRQC